jgi:hypothetical protein
MISTEITVGLVRRAEQAGYKAIVLTVDAPVLGNREADVRNHFSVPSHLTMANFGPQNATSDYADHRRAAGHRQGGGWPRRGLPGRRRSSRNGRVQGSGARSPRRLRGSTGPVRPRSQRTSITLPPVLGLTAHVLVCNNRGKRASRASCVSSTTS